MIGGGPEAAVSQRVRNWEEELEVGGRRASTAWNLSVPLLTASGHEDFQRVMFVVSLLPSIPTSYISSFARYNPLHTEKEFHET